MARTDSTAARRHFAAWTTLTFVAEAALLAGLLAVSRVASGVGINVGFFGLLAVALGATRRVSFGLRIGPLLVGTLLLGLWPLSNWVLRGDADTAAAFVSVAIILATMVAIVGTLVFLARRNLIVDTPVRRGLTLALTVWLSVSALISFPVGVWKGRMGLAALVVLLAILVWPTRR